MVCCWISSPTIHDVQPGWNPPLVAMGWPRRTPPGCTSGRRRVRVPCRGRSDAPQVRRTAAPTVASEQREAVQGRSLMRGRKGGDAEIATNEFGGTRASSDGGD
jgi:hypothetical protein